MGGEGGGGEAAGWKGMEGQRNGGVEVGGAREEARRRRSGGRGRWQQRKSATERHGPPPHEATIFCFGLAVLIVS